MKPLVSIIIPMYNASEFIKDMIESIKRQSYQDWELIIVDDISIDNSREIVRDYINQDKRISLLVRDESDVKGASNCRNIGLDKSKGKYIIFLDADDYIAEYCIEQRVSYMEMNQNLDFSVYPVVAFKNRPYDVPRQFFGYGAKYNILGSFIARTLPFLVVSNIYKRESLIDKSVFWDTNLKSFQDSDFNMTALDKHLKFCVTNLRPDYFWRVSGNTNSISKKIISSEHIVSHLYFFNKLVGLFENTYSKELLVLTHLLIEIFIDANRITSISDLLQSKFFDKYPILRLKINFLIRIFVKLKCSLDPLKLKLLIFILCPILHLRFIVCHGVWYITRRRYWNKLLRTFSYN